MSLRGRRPDPAPLDPAVLEDALGRGAARWPGVPVSHEKFRERLGRVLGPRAGDSPGVLEAIHVEDLYLVSALEAGSNEAWRTFVREFRPHVVQALARVLHDPREQDEMADELLGGLLLPGAGAAASPLGTYSGRGGLKGWLQVSAIRRVYRRARRRQREGWVGLECEPAARAEEQPDARLGRTEALEALRKTLPVALRALPEADRTLLRLRFERGFGLSELGRLYGQDKSTLSKRLKSVAEKLRKALGRALEEAGGFDLEDAESVWEALDRERPEGLDRWLGPEAPP